MRIFFVKRNSEGVLSLFVREETSFGWQAENFIKEVHGGMGEARRLAARISKGEPFEFDNEIKENQDG